jgi:predicted RNA-binding protein with PIN domain
VRWTIIDGYNLLFRDEDSEGSLERARESFLRAVDAVRPPGEMVIVVFDGRSAPAPKLRQAEGLTVCFSRNATADEEILARIAKLPKGQATVLTHDRELSRRVRRAGGRVGDPKAFFRLSRFHAGPPPREKPPPPSPEEVERWERLFGEAHPED